MSARTNTAERLERLQARCSHNLPEGAALRMPGRQIAVLFADAVWDKLERAHATQPPPQPEQPSPALQLAYDELGLSELGITLPQALRDLKWRHVLERAVAAAGGRTHG